MRNITVMGKGSWWSTNELELAVQFIQPAPHHFKNCRASRLRGACGRRAIFVGKTGAHVIGPPTQGSHAGHGPGAEGLDQANVCLLTVMHVLSRLSSCYLG